MRERPGRLSRNIRVVSAVSFFQDAASELLYPVLPFFVTGALGAPPAVLGMIEGVADGTASVVRLFSGRLADLRRRRPLIGLGYGLSALGKLLLALATVWPSVLASRFVDRVGKGLRGPPRDALIADEASESDRGRSFGFHRAADTAGAVVGPLVGLGLYEVLDGEFRTLFFVALVPSAVSALLVLAIRERPHAPPPAADRRWEPRGLPSAYWRVVGILGLFALVNFPDALLLLRADDLGLGYAGVVLAYVLYNLTYAVCSYPAGIASDRFSRPTIFAGGLVVFAVAYLGFGLTTSPVWVWVLLPVYGAYTALTDGVSRAWIADLVPAGSRGTALGLHSAVTGAGLLVAGIWAGFAWGDSGKGPFLVAGTTALAIACVLVVGRARLLPSS